MNAKKKATKTKYATLPKPQPFVMPIAPPIKKSKVKLIAGVIIGVLVVACGVAWGAYDYFTNTPNYLFAHAFQQLGQADTVAAKIVLAKSPSGGGANFNGDFAVHADKNSKSGELVLGIGTGSGRLSLTMLGFQDIAYLRVDNIANLGSLSQQLGADPKPYNTEDFKAAVKPLDGKWFSITKEQSQTLADGAVPFAGQGGAIQPDDLQKLGDIYAKAPFFKPGTVFNDDTIDDTRSAHFTIAVDKPLFKVFLANLQKANLKALAVPDESIKESDALVDTASRQGAVDIWIARDSKKLKQIKVHSNQKDGLGSMTLTFVTNLPAFGQLAKPAEAQPFEDLFTTLLGPTLDTPPTNQQAQQPPAL